MADMPPLAKCVYFWLALADFIMNVRGGFVAFSIIPHLAAKVKMFFALAPSYTLQYTKSVILQLTRLPEPLLKTTPPLYDIEAITIPIAMWSGGQDWASQPPEIAQLRHRITNLIHEKKFPEWNHWDFIWGLDAASCLYKEILALMATL
ncbi:PREDICTED: lysosomal acid lipase/cholesteryl ester hydrolase-like [Thamnophis sirtalis]|uniref:Lysosomal acid lipase/cholesteryl ester hydrolase-like n=1 Tax=Thamnophis sirtalis TaxID=35019 RepID=A0A6I9XR38_9SAUR|nr:PREDICTED: lysosomal acid lipase/cholesteryl ester hydrolase-like [Thamnophis sirtalis]